MSLAVPLADRVSHLESGSGPSQAEQGNQVGSVHTVRRWVAGGVVHGRAPGRNHNQVNVRRWDAESFGDRRCYVQARGGRKGGKLAPGQTDSGSF